MKNFTVELYAIEWCGFSHYYEVIAENEDFAEDLALEKYEQDFVDMYSLVLVEGGYLESCDFDDETGEYDEDDVTLIGTRIVS